MGHPRLSEEKKIQILGYKTLFPHVSYRELAEKFQVSEVTAWNVCNEKRRKTHNTLKRPTADPRRPPLRPAVTDPSLLSKLTAGRA